tara:strand:+ start:403 stop:1233 length:831 start_codon:yes stop_codon:yes gene_type:complete
MIPVGRSWTSGLWEVRRIKEVRVVDGKREWLVAWSGTDGTGKQWADSWEPTRSLTPDLKQSFLYDRAQRALRVVEVDARPLDTLVQRAIAQSVMGELGATFGSVHYIPVHALSLGDLALAYMRSLSERFGILPSEATVRQVTTVELTLTEPNQVGEYCEFERFMPANTGTGALRYALGRKSNTDAIVVMPLTFVYSDNKHTPGCVSFNVEISTCKINGVTGTLTPPHLGSSSKNKLKTDEYKNLVITYARKTLPRTHTLIENDGWHNLPPNVHAVR